MPAATGKDLVHIALVTYIPDNAVSSGVKNRVQGYGQFDYAQIGSQMASAF